MDLFLQALTQGILVGGTYALIALGMAVIFSVSGMVNFAHGDFLLVGMYLAYSLFAALHLDPYLSVFITFPVMCLAGAGLYAFLLRRLTSSNLLMAVQLTLGLSFVVQNTLLLVFGGEPIRAPSVVETDLLVVGNIIIRTPQLIAFLAALSLSTAFYLTLNFTDAGRRIQAVHQQPRAAALIGVNVPLVRTLTFAFGIGVLAIAAVLIISGDVDGARAWVALDRHRPDYSGARRHDQLRGDISRCDPHRRSGIAGNSLCVRNVGNDRALRTLHHSCSVSSRRPAEEGVT